MDNIDKEKIGTIIEYFATHPTTTLSEIATAFSLNERYIERMITQHYIGPIFSGKIICRQSRLNTNE
jgi:hypothetical protein